MLPLAVALGDGDEIVAEEHAGDARDREEALRQRRTGSALGIARVEGAGIHHHDPGQELERGGIGRRFGLNEHRSSFRISALLRARQR
jgi:hypothetical protein